MGAWGFKAWDSDGAADWFADAFEGSDIDAALDAAFRYDDNTARIRAAAYLLTVLGCSAYVWPGDLDRLDGHVKAAVAALSAMVDPTTPQGRELRAMWGEESEVHAEIARELEALRAAHPRRV